MGFLKYKGYSGSVEFSPEDNCLFGKVQGLHKATIIYRLILSKKSDYNRFENMEIGVMAPVPEKAPYCSVIIIKIRQTNIKQFGRQTTDSPY